MADVFISYSRVDLAFVRRLHDALDARGKDVWMDERDIAPSADWLAEIYAGIEGADDIVFVVSPESVASGICASEVSHAEKHGKRIVPIVVRELGDQAAPTAIAARNWIFFRESDSFDSALDTLVQALDTDLERVHAHTRLLVRAREWEDGGRNPSGLLNGIELRAAEALVTAPSDAAVSPTDLQREFVLASRRRATRRTQTLLGAVVVALLVTLALAALAWQQRGQARHQATIARQQARIALSRALAATASARLDTQLDTAALLALEAYRQAPTAEVRSVLVRTVERGTRIAPLAPLPGATGSLPVAFSPTADLVAASAGANVLIWDLRSRRLLATLPDVDSQQVNTIAFSPDGRLVASSGLEGSVGIWSVATHQLVGERFALLGEPEYVTSLVFADGGRTIAAADQYGRVGLWRVRDHHLIRELQIAGDAVVALAVSPDGRTIACGSESGLAFVDVPRMRVLPQRLRIGGEARAVAYSPDGTLFAAGNAGGVVRLWHVRDGRPAGQPVLLRGHRGGVAGIVFDPNGPRLATVSGRGKLQFWDSKRGRPLSPPLETHIGRADRLAISRHGSLLAISGDEPLALWNLATISPRLDAREASFVSLSSELALSPQGDRVLEVDQAGQTARLWAFLAPQRAPRDLHFHDAWGGAAFDPSGELAAVGGRKGRVGLWKVRGGGPSWLDTKHADDDVDLLAFSADGRRLAAGASSTGRVSVFDLPERRLVSSWVVHGRLDALAFAPDGVLVVGAVNTITFWDSTDGTTRGQRLMLGGDFVSALAVSADGVLAASGSDGAIRLWDVRAQHTLAPALTGHTSTVRGLAFSADGATLASTSADGTLRLWAVPSGTPLGGVLRAGSPGGRRESWAVRFTSDGRRLDWITSTDIENEISSGTYAYFVTDRARALWSVDLGQFERELCPVARRELTRAEWTAFLPGVPYHATCPQPAAVS